MLERIANTSGISGNVAFGSTRAEVCRPLPSMVVRCVEVGYRAYNELELAPVNVEHGTKGLLVKLQQFVQRPEDVSGFLEKVGDQLNLWSGGLEDKSIEFADVEVEIAAMGEQLKAVVSDNSVPARQRSIAHTYLASICFLQARPTMSSAKGKLGYAHYEKARQVDPSCPSAWTNYALSLAVIDALPWAKRTMVTTMLGISPRKELPAPLEKLFALGDVRSHAYLRAILENGIENDAKWITQAHKQMLKSVEQNWPNSQEAKDNLENARAAFRIKVED